MDKKIAIIIPLLFAITLSTIAVPMASADPDWIVYDDGTMEHGVSWIAPNKLLVLFTPPFHPCHVVTAQFYVVWWTSGTFKLHVMDASFHDVITAFDVTPTSKQYWFTVDLSSYDITIAKGDFYIAAEYLGAVYSNPSFGYDDDGTQYERSYEWAFGYQPIPFSAGNLMFRAEVVPAGPEYLLEDLKAEINELPTQAFRFPWLVQWQKAALCKQVNLAITNIETDRDMLALGQLQALNLQLTSQIQDPYRTELIGKVNITIDMLQIT